ncbi:hypothetical protein [uncultured Enorma sp.]|uniref:hypothetical protein n=1 Tax=uncultured Enorma sp. TaxID=1714346 RepID=UPI00265EFF5B|nr:hypothetical protein [uncultured Enorma sp.]
MASQQRTQLNQNNRIYLYDLFRTKFGCGRQTFVTQVEEALASDGLDACSLGYEDTRALLEDLDAFVTLTVFKGGRLYATIEAQPEWDEALDAANNGTGAGTGSAKPWKRKRGQRPLKPVRPQVVVVEEPVDAEAPADEDAAAEEPSAEQLAEDADDGASSAEHEGAAVEDANNAAKSPERDAVDVVADGETNTAPADETSPCEPSGAVDGKDASPDAAADEPSDEPAATPAAEAPEPAISLTVIYDPEHANAGIQTLASTPVSTAPAKQVDEALAAANPAAQTENAGEATAPLTARPSATPTAAPQQPSATPTAAPQPQPAPTAPLDLDAYPKDFATDVWCPANLLSELTALLPYGADVLGIASEWFLIACERGTAELSRNRAAFPLRYLCDGERCSATIRLKRRPASDTGAPWALEAVETA